MAKPKTPGRPRKYPTEKQIKKVGLLMATGISATRAIVKANIPCRTGERWLARGRIELEQEIDSPYADLALVVEAANAQLVARAENYLHRAQDLPSKELAARDKLHNVRWILRTMARDTYGEDAGVERLVQRRIEDMVESLRNFMNARDHEALEIGILKMMSAQESVEEPANDDPEPLVH